MQIEVTNSRPQKRFDLSLNPEYNLVTGINTFKEFFTDISSLEEDLILLASSVFASDLANQRGEREEYTRDFYLEIPVVNIIEFLKIKSELESLLYLLSNDNWEINFIQKSGNIEVKKVWPKNNGSTLLFSGGLDSFAASVDLLENNNDLVLISHITHNQTIRNSQENLFKTLKEKHLTLKRYAFLISGRNNEIFPFPTDSDREETQRTRSFLFLTLAAIVSRREGYNRILFIAENGQLAIHLPLNAARIGAFSTHTAHPEALFNIQNILSQILNYNIKIENPFLYKTKAETIKNAMVKYESLIPKTLSCWRGSRVKGDKIHCGVCVPCLIRRIAIEANGKSILEYDRDIFIEDIEKLDDDDIGKRNLSDLLEFIHFFASNMPELKIVHTYPDLINDHIDLKQAIDMYKRFAKESLSVLKKYKKIKKMI